MDEREGWWYEVGPINGSDRSFDILFWQAQGPEAIFVPLGSWLNQLTK